MHIHATLKQRLTAIHTLRAQHQIKTLCRVLGVNRSTYYKHFNTAPAKRSLQNQEFRTQILDVYAKSSKRFGAYKIKQKLMTEYGTNISAGRVYKELKVPLLMKGMQLPKMSTVKPKLSTTKIDQGLPCLNLLKQQFNPCVPNQVWVSDITYIKAGTRFCYLCVIIDLFARKVIAYDVSYSINTELVLSVFDKAYVARRMPCGVMFHSDRGVQYTACKFRQRLDQVNFVQSFSAKAYPFDNAVAESFFKFLKHEETSRKSFPDIHQLELALFEYMNFYNAHRPHSANNRLTPDQKKSLFTS